MGDFGRPDSSGRTVSQDGRWLWDGQRWVPNPATQEVVGQRSPWLAIAIAGGVILVLLFAIGQALAPKSAGNTLGPPEANAPTSPPATCSPSPCLVDHNGMTLYVAGVHPAAAGPGYSWKAGLQMVAVDVKWEYAGSSSRSPLTGQVYVITADKVVVSQSTSSTGGDCASYDTPELATGGTFGPKPICFDLGAAPDAPLVLRWKHGILGGADQDLVIK